MNSLFFKKNTTRIIRSHRQTLALVITSDATLTVRAPLRMPMFEIEQFITAKHVWITRMQERQLQKPTIRVSKEQIVVYKKQARHILKERVAMYAPRMGVQCSSIRITNAKQRWGSCGPHGSLNFTWRLMVAPPQVQDYVVVHELAHITYRSHSSRFWAKVAATIPHFKLHKKWLREHTIG